MNAFSKNLLAALALVLVLPLSAAAQPKYGFRNFNLMWSLNPKVSWTSTARVGGELFREADAQKGIVAWAEDCGQTEESDEIWYEIETYRGWLYKQLLPTCDSGAKYYIHELRRLTYNNRNMLRLRMRITLPSGEERVRLAYVAAAGGRLLQMCIEMPASEDAALQQQSADYWPAVRPYFNLSAYE